MTNIISIIFINLVTLKAGAKHELLNDELATVTSLNDCGIYRNFYDDTYRNGTHHNDPHHNDNHHNETHKNDTHHNDTHHNDTHKNDIHHNDTHHNDTHHNDTQHVNLEHNCESQLTDIILSLC